MNYKSIFLPLFCLLPFALGAQNHPASAKPNTTETFDSTKSAHKMSLETVTHIFDFPPNDGAIQFFKPLDFQGQRTENLYKMRSERVIARSIGAGLALILLIGTILLLRQLQGITTKIIVGALGLLVAAGIGFFFLIFDAYANLSDGPGSKAADRLISLARQLKVEWQYYSAIPDEDYRLGLLENSKGAVIVDYKNNQGWRILKGQVAAIIANPDTTFTEGKAVHLVTAEAKEKDYHFELVFLLKSNDPARIHLQYHSIAGMSFDAVSQADSFKRIWEQTDSDLENNN